MDSKPHDTPSNPAIYTEHALRELDRWDTELLLEWARVGMGIHGIEYRAPGETVTTADLRQIGEDVILRMRVDYAGLQKGYGYSFEQARQRLAPTPPEHAEQVDAQLEHELQRLRTRRDAHRLLAAETAESIDMPDLVTLDVFLDQIDTDPEYRIDRLLPTGGNVLFPAPAKAGKSTTMGNVCRSFADGAPFLGTFATKPARVALIDNEMDERGLRRWLREQGIQNPQNITVIPLRGRTRSFDILDPATRARWAEALRGADVLIFDCLRPVLDALGLDENRDAGQFLVALDALKTEAGISEAILVHHMGHNADRARGDSRLLGWPDVTWKITVERVDDPIAPRFFSAFGRDVAVPETQLQYDPENRRYTVTALSRRDAAIEVAVEWAREVLARPEHQQGVSQNQIEQIWKDETPGIPRSDLKQALHVLQARGESIVIPGPRNAKLHYLLPHLASSPDLAATSPASTPDHLAAPLRGEVANSTANTEPHHLANGELNDRTSS